MIDLLTLINEDAFVGLQQINSSSVDLVITSPPYAEQRKDKYKSIAADKYIEWFLPIASQIKRILKPTGSFMLNMKAHCEKGERTLYVMELVIALKKYIGFKFIDEYVWYKSASPRRKSVRLKNAWEPFYHFAIDKNYINHDVIQIKSSSTFGNKRGYKCFNDLTGNIGGYHDIADQQNGSTDPDNILYFPTSLLVKDKFPHPAKFPLELINFFIRGFSPQNGTVCDPFIGSGITALASLILGRQCIGIDIEKKYCNMTFQRIEEYIPPEIRKIPPHYVDIFD